MHRIGDGGDIGKGKAAVRRSDGIIENKYKRQKPPIPSNRLRNLLRLAKDPNLYPNQKPCLNFHTWEVWMRKVDEIGRMIGGYSEWVNSRERQK